VQVSSDCGGLSAAFSFPGSQIPARSSHRKPPRQRLTGADTLECGSWLPLFRRPNRRPAKHPQPGFSQENQLRFDSYVNL